MVGALCLMLALVNFLVGDKVSEEKFMIKVNIPRDVVKAGGSVL